MKIGEDMQNSVNRQYSDSSCGSLLQKHELDYSLAGRADHALWVCDEVRADVAPLKLHALNNIQVVLSSAGLLHGDHALPSNPCHGIADQLAYLHSHNVHL